MVWNWLRRHPWFLDAAIVAGLSIGYFGDALHRERWLDLPLAALTVFPLFWRRRAPLLVLVIVTAAATVHAFAYSSDVPIAPAIAIVTVAARVDRRRSLLFCAPAAAVFLAAVGIAVAPSHMIPNGILFAAAWIGGDALRTRRAYLDELEEKAERLERERETEAARAVAEEQARIARELHDVIAHNLSVIVVQAAAANDVFEARPERAREALREIEATGRGALAELRRLLGTVRREYGPQPGLERLDDLVSQVRNAGLDVTVSIEGNPRELPAGVDLSAYRIVQEALTNTLKHADATRADIALRFVDDVFDLEVRDDGRGNGN